MSNKKTHPDNQQPKQPKKNTWAKKLRKPATVRNVISWGITAYKVSKWLIEFFDF